MKYLICYDGSEAAKSALKLAQKDQDIKGVILKINSPGGTVIHSDLIYKLILRDNYIVFKFI